MKVIECPRDAMQGIKRFISTSEKIDYLRLLMQCGFHTLDCGSFVSSAHVPQMADTATVLEEIQSEKGENRFLCIVANERGALEAASHACVDYLGFPFSINETFQKRNTNAGILESYLNLQKIHNIASAAGKETVAYISMAFGNPYGEPYSTEQTLYWAEKIADLGIKIISLSDTAGDAHIKDVDYLFRTIITAYPELEIGAHFHAKPGEWEDKIETAYNAGCRRFDGAIMGFGGCPMAKDDLTGNIPTEEMARWLDDRESTGIDFAALSKAAGMAPGIFLSEQ